MGLLYNQLKAFGLLNEMTDWKRHFTDGTKGMPKTNPPILNYVENLLKKTYPEGTAPEKINNNPLAPWLVMAINNLGPANINTVRLNQIKSVIQYFIKTGNASFLKAHRTPEGFNVTPIEDAGNYAAEKLEKIKQKEEKQTKEKEEQEKQKETPMELPKDDIPTMQSEVNGQIQRVWVSNDGSKRMWVKVLDNKWLTQNCDAGHAKGRKWGVVCQSTNPKFLDSSHTNYQFIGPEKGKNAFEYSTIIGMAVSNTTNLITELKQEGNVQPGSQKNSGGWTDGAEQAIDFICNSPEMKSNVIGFGAYGGGIPTSATSTYGGDAFLVYIINNKIELFNYLASNRPDILSINETLVNKLLGPEWVNNQLLDIDKFVNDPVEFIKKFELLFKKYGKQAVEVLNTFDLDKLAQVNPTLIQNSLGSLVGNIPVEKFDKLISSVNMPKYILEKTESFQSLIKNMSNLPQYSNLFKNLIYDHSQYIIQAFGDRGVGIFKFLQFASSPKLRQHSSAKLDAITGEYIGKRNVVENPGEGHANRIVAQESFVIPDNLKILNQKERRDFIIKNKDYILSLTPNLTPEGKEINYLRFLFSESNINEVQKSMMKDKDMYIDFYNKKFKAGEVKKVKGPDGNIIEQPYIPGVFEFYASLNKKKPGYIITGNETFNVRNKIFSRPTADRAEKERLDNKETLLKYYPMKTEDVEKNSVDILKYYYDIRKKQYANQDKPTNKIGLDNKQMQNVNQHNKVLQEAQVRNLMARDYLYTLKLSGLNDEQILKEYYDKFTPEKLNTDPKTTIGFMLDNILFLLDDSNAYKAIIELKPYIDSLGPLGENAYEKSIEKLRKTLYMVKENDMIEYIGFDSKIQQKDSGIYYGNLNLTRGRKYKVLGVRDSDKIINFEVLILDEGAAGTDENPPIYPTERWIGTYFFKVPKKLVLPNEIPSAENNIQEVRNLIKKRLNIMTEKLEKKKRISYTGIILDNRSKEKLKGFIKEMQKAKKVNIPDGWEFSADHITINMGPAIHPETLGQEVAIKVLTYAFNENVMAVGVNVDMELEYEKENPHITLAFNAAAGARPVMSNKLEVWKPVPKSFVVTGIIQEVYQEI